MRTGPIARAAELRSQRNQIACQGPKLCVGGLIAWVSMNAEETGQNPDHVAIEDRDRLVEGDTRNRSSGIATNPGQRQNLVELLGKFSSMFSGDQLGGSLKVPSPSVIAKTFPKF